MDIELHDAVLPADSHVARTTIVDPDGTLSEGEEAELYTYGDSPPHKAGLRITRFYDVFPDRQLWP